MGSLKPDTAVSEAGARDRRNQDLPPLQAGRTALRLLGGGVLIGAVVLGLGWLLTKVSHHNAFLRADTHVERWLAAHRTPWLNHVTFIVTWLAETPTAIALAAVLFVGLRLWLHRWRESFIVLTALVGELLVFLMCTALIDRSRPPVHHLDHAPPTSSFPSGHTGAAVALYGSLAVILLIHSGRRGLTWPVAALLMFVPLAVAASRLYRGMHFPTDVAVGALNGTLWVFLAVSTLLPKVPTPPIEESGGYKRPVVIRNPTKSDDPETLEAEVNSLLVASGLPPARWVDTTADDPGFGQTKQALADGADLILACGGDGTVRACVSALLGTEVPLALLPLGTGNLLARNLDVPRTFGEAIKLIAAGDRRVIDVGELDGEIFAVMGGAGFDAQMFDYTSDRLKSRIGWGAYVVAGARALRAARSGDVLLTLDGVVIPTRGVGVLIGNVGTLTGGLALLPQARPDDRLLDIAVLTATSPTHWLGLVWHVVTGKRPQPWQLEHHTAAKVEVRFESDLPVELDGDVIGSRRGFTARVRPASVTVCAPASDPKGGA